MTSILRHDDPGFAVINKEGNEVRSVSRGWIMWPQAIPVSWTDAFVIWGAINDNDGWRADGLASERKMLSTHRSSLHKLKVLASCVCCRSYSFLLYFFYPNVSLKKTISSTNNCYSSITYILYPLYLCKWITFLSTYFLKQKKIFVVWSFLSARHQKKHSCQYQMELAQTTTILVWRWHCGV